MSTYPADAIMSPASTSRREKIHAIPRGSDRTACGRAIGGSWMPMMAPSGSPRQSRDFSEWAHRPTLQCGSCRTAMEVRR